MSPAMGVFITINKTMEKVLIICFSPTGNTHKVCETIHKAIQDQYEIDFLDITLPDVRRKISDGKISGDILVVASPVYSQTAAEQFINFLKRSRLVFKKSIVVCTYGGISCGAAIRDVTKILSKKGIPVIAAAEIPCRHHYAFAGINKLEEMNIPDNSAEISDFIKKACVLNSRMKTDKKIYAAKLLSQKTIAHIAAYISISNLCQKCGKCINICPTGAIKSDFTVNIKMCIGCVRCVLNCPYGARKLVFKNFIPVIYLKHGVIKSEKNKLSCRFYY